MIVKKELIKKCLISALGTLMAFSTLFSSVAYAKEYEDKYATNSKIGSRVGEGYEALYELNNHCGAEQHVIMYFVRQDKWTVEQNDFERYQFEGKFDSEETYGTHLFEFDLGMPMEYNKLDTVQLGNETGVLHQAQFGIYPGYYNFHNYGYENYVGYGSNTACSIQTLSPDFKLGEGYTEDPGIWVEVEEGAGDPRIYVLIGEVEWISEVSAYFEEWAKEYDSKIVENSNEQEVQTEASNENTNTPNASVDTDKTGADSGVVAEDNSKEMEAIYSVNPRHYEDIKNDEVIEDTQREPEIVTNADTGEEVGSVTYVAVDGLGYPIGMGGHYKGYTVGTRSNVKLGYRFVNLRASGLSFYQVEWNENLGEYSYSFVTPKGDATIYFYYEPKDYEITIDDKLAEYITVQPYGDEGEMVPIRISRECPYNVQVLLSNGSEELEIVDKVTIVDQSLHDEEGNYLTDVYHEAFEMYGEPIKLVAVEKEQATDSGAGKMGILIPIAAVGVVGVIVFLVVLGSKKKK